MCPTTSASPRVDRRPRRRGRGRRRRGFDADALGRPGVRRRRPLPRQLHVGHHRAAQVRDAQPEPLDVLPPARGRRRATSPATTCSSARSPRPSGSGSGRRTSRPRCSGAPRSCRSASTPTRALRAIERERVTRARVREHAVPHDAELAGARAARPAARCGACSPAVRRCPYERAARFEDVTGARVLQFYGSNETGALSRTTMRRRPRAPTEHRRPGHPRDARAAARRRRARHHRARRARQPGLQGTRHLLRLPRRRAGERRAVHERRLDAHRRRVPRSTPTATSASSAARPTSSSGAARTSARPRSRPRSPSIRRSRSRRWWRCPTRCSASGCASTPSSAPTPRSSSPTSSSSSRERGVSREWFPERLVVLDALPRASGGKVAKGELRARGT